MNFGQLKGAGAGDAAHGQDHQVEDLLLGPARFIDIAEAQVAGVRQRLDPEDPGADQPGPLLFETDAIFFEVLARGAQVHVEQGHVQLGADMLPGDDGLLEGRHATKIGAVRVGPLPVAAHADAMEPGDLPGFPPVQGPHDVAFIGAGGAENPLKLQAGKDIGGVEIIIGRQVGRIEDLIARGQDHRAHLHFPQPRLVVVLHGAGQADFLAQAATETGVPVDHEGPGHRLGVLDVGGAAAVQTQVELVHRLGRAGALAVAAGGALLRQDIARLILQDGPEISGLTRQGIQLRAGDDLQVVVPADLDQLGRDNSHGAVVGGKGLVDLGHGAPDGGGAFHQIDKVPGIGQIQGGLHSGNAASHHQHRADFARPFGLHGRLPPGILAAVNFSMRTGVHADRDLNVKVAPS
jgi:hypothetical protein